MKKTFLENQNLNEKSLKLVMIEVLKKKIYLLNYYSMLNYMLNLRERKNNKF